MKAKSAASSDDMRAEYGFDYSKAVRGKYYRRLLKEGANVVVLEPDVATAFRSSAAVNEALRSPTPDVRGNPALDFALQRTGDKRPPLSARVEGQRTVNRNGRIDAWPDRRASCLRRR